MALNELSLSCPNAFIIPSPVTTTLFKSLSYIKLNGAKAPNLLN
jgi:hypothetical protein